MTDFDADASDADVWSQVRAGNGQLFGVLFDRHRDRVFRYSFRLGNPLTLCSRRALGTRRRRDPRHRPRRSPSTPHARQTAPQPHARHRFLGSSLRRAAFSATKFKTLQHRVCCSTQFNSTKNVKSTWAWANCGQIRQIRRNIPLSQFWKPTLTRSFSGAACQNRTDDLLITSEMLYQLS